MSLATADTPRFGRGGCAANSARDVLLGIGWLDPGAVKRWQAGQIDYLEHAVQVDSSRICTAMQLFQAWATTEGLIASETSCVARTPLRQPLRFSQN
jgi:hypothetical protein